jgi:hypothetical protein
MSEPFALTPAEIDDPMNLKLAQTRFGRVLLHVICCLRDPRHLIWHWHGVRREFGSARQIDGKFPASL